MLLIGRRTSYSIDFSRLVTHIARDRRDGYTYVAAVRWLRYQRAELPVHTELRADSGL